MERIIITIPPICSERAIA